VQSFFLTLFGRSPRVTACACERSGEVTMPQLLHLQNGASVVEKVRSGEGRLAKLLKAKRPEDEVVEELLGIDPRKLLRTPDGRPLEILDKGENVKELFV
jgi:hypothetical protein